MKDKPADDKNPLFLSDSPDVLGCHALVQAGYMADKTNQKAQPSPRPEMDKGAMTKMTKKKTTNGIPETNLRIWLAVIGLLAFFALLVATVILANMGQQMPAVYTGTGAVAVGVVRFYKMLLVLGRPS